jgi:multiple sugar transport system permease protein
MISPTVLLLLAITAFPLLFNLWNSFHYDNLLNPAAGHPFTGLANYTRIFSSQTGLLAAVEHTVAYTLVSVPVEVVIGLGIALLLDRPIRGRGICRALILLPWAVPSVVSAIMWRTLLDPQTGAVNYVLGLLHLPGSHTTWLNASTFSTWLAIGVIDIWQSVPFVAILLLAGLQGIPRELYEAAQVDGVTAWRTFRRITLPLLRPALLVTLVFRTLSAFLIFDIIYALTGGGPGTATTTLSYVDWSAFLVNSDFGLGGAISIVMIIAVLAIAAVYRATLKPQTP